VSFIPLPQLHALTLSYVDLSTAQLMSLLRGCPALQTIVLCGPAFTLALLLFIGRTCRRLKKLEAHGYSKALLCEPVQEALTEAYWLPAETRPSSRSWWR
jgi:hypothetical protein